jgi:hypothetical protein
MTSPSISDHPRTPPSQTSPKPPLFSPIKRANKPSIGSGASNHSLQEARGVVFEEVVDTGVFTLDRKKFIKNVLPHIQPGVLQGTRERLVKRLLNRDGGWKESILDKNSKQNENQWTAKITGIFDEVRKAIKDEKKALGVTLNNAAISMQSNPHTSPYSLRDNTSRPDADITAPHKLFDELPKGIIIEKEERSHWLEIFVVLEAKLHASKVHEVRIILNVSGGSILFLPQNLVQVLWGMHNCLREDMRRRFTYGITVDSASEVRLYFLCRSGMIASEPFDLFKVCNTSLYLPLLFFFFLFFDHRVMNRNPRLSSTLFVTLLIPQKKTWASTPPFDDATIPKPVLPFFSRSVLTVFGISSPRFYRT